MSGSRTTLGDALAAHGIKTAADLDRLKGNDSRYGYLARTFGQVNADRIMRILEVASWDFTLRA